MTDFGVRFTALDPRIEMVPESGCWIWMRGLSHKGYGATEIAQRTWQAHRAFWVAVNGTIPTGMYLDHVCRVRSCVNPAHLRVVTPRQNSLENSVSLTAINAAKACCPKCGGEYHRDSFGSRQCTPCRTAYKMEWAKRTMTPERRLVLAATQRRYNARRRLRLAGGGSVG